MEQHCNPGLVIKLPFAHMSLSAFVSISLILSLSMKLSSNPLVLQIKQWDVLLVIFPCKGQKSSSFTQDFKDRRIFQNSVLAQKTGSWSLVSYWMQGKRDGRLKVFTFMYVTFLVETMHSPMFPLYKGAHDLSLKSLRVWTFLERFVLPLRSTHGWEMRSWRSCIECTFPSTSHPSLVNTQLSASIFKLFKLASSDYTSNPTDYTCHLGSIISILSHRAIILQRYTQSIPRSEKNTKDCSKVTPWEYFSESPIHRGDPQLVCVTLLSMCLPSPWL